MRRVDWVTYRNKKSVVALVGKPPRGIPRVDVIALFWVDRERRGRLRRRNTIYMTPDETADHIRVLSTALSVVTRRKRYVFARTPR